jgi:gliding motility-associatede transport system auxiliary component
MSRTLSWLPVLALAIAALILGALGASHLWDERDSNILFFAAWCAAVLLLFVFGLRLPPRISGSRFRAMLFNIALAAGAVVIACLANVAIFRHDVFLDLSHEAANTPPPQLESVLDGLRTDVSLLYFYNHSDANARKAKDLLTVASRQSRHFQFQAIDLDKEPAKAREFGVRAYNTALLQAEGRRVVVENTVDLAQVAFAALRVLKKQVDVVCFVSGHGEVIAEGPPHFHYSHVETLKGHEVPGAGDTLQGEPDGLDRLQLAMATLGYSVRPIVLTTLSAIPADCNVVAEIGPHRAYAPGEAARLSDYLAHGGRLLIMVDPAFPLGDELSGLLGKVGLSSEQAIVIDPLNHYGADEEKVAIPYYPPHPITERLALTIFPDARPIRVEAAPAGVRTTILAASSKDSYLRPAPLAAGGAISAEPGAAPHGAAVLAVAVEGRWPDAPGDETKPFRLVLVGDANFATNSYFPYVSNGDLVVRMIRWLADDAARPGAQPQTFSPLQRITLTRDQMRDIFVMVEIILPMSVVLFGGIVWWRRR